MSQQPRYSRNDVLNALVAGGVAAFSLLIGGSLLLGMYSEPEKAERFLFILGWGMVLGGVGCALYCFHIWTGKLFNWLYAVSLVLTIAGYGLALLAEAMYAQW
jgi:hypothetical protein